MKILVIEPKWTGHHLGFARHLAEALVTASTEVALSISHVDEGLGAEWAEDALSGLDPRIELHRSLAGPAKGYLPISSSAGALEGRIIAKEIERALPDIVVLPSADTSSYFLGRRTSTARRIERQPVFACLHRLRLGYHGRGLRFALRRESVRLRLRSARISLASVDNLSSDADDSLGIRHLPIAVPVATACSRADARRRFGINENATVFLAAGEHSQRKGTDRVVRCWPEVDSSEAVLLIVGRCSEQLKHTISLRNTELQRGSIIVRDGVIDTGTFTAAFSACDVVTALYSTHFGSSSIMATAVRMDRPVLGSRYGWIGDAIQRGGLGLAIDVSTEQEMSRAITACISELPELDPLKHGAMKAWFSEDNFRAICRRWIIGSDPENLPSAPYPG